MIETGLADMFREHMPFRHLEHRVTPVHHFSGHGRGRVVRRGHWDGVIATPSPEIVFQDFMAPLGDWDGDRLGFRVEIVGERVGAHVPWVWGE